jgi:TusA-related sulfurtransferase
MKIIDTKGLVCPQPLILTKKALKEVEVNEQFMILLDNETSVQNINRFLKENNAQSEIAKEDEIYKIIVTKLPENIPEPA